MSAPDGGRRVAVAMATCNGARYLPAQLASLAAQTRLPDELAVGDDGSTDATPAILDEFAARAPFPVRVTRNPERLGPAANFFATIARCEADVVLLSDQDDVWHPDKCARLLDFLGADPRRLLAIHDAAIVDAAGRPSGLTLGGQIAAAGGNPAEALEAGCCMAIDARLARAFVPAPPTPTHDCWAAQLAGLLGVRAYLDTPLIDYRRHGGNVSQSYMARLGRTHRLARFADRAAKARAQPVRAALTASLASNAAMLEALACHHGVLAAVAGEPAVAQARAELARRIGRDRRRLAFHAAGGTTRWRALAAGLRAGDYRGFDGALSLARDLLG